MKPLAEETLERVRECVEQHKATQISAEGLVRCDQCAGTGIDSTGGMCVCCDDGVIEVLEWIDAEDVT